MLFTATFLSSCSSFILPSSVCPLLLQSCRCCVADMNVMAEEKVGRWFCWDSLTLSSTFLSPPGGALPVSTCSPETPLRLSRSPHVMQNAYQHNAKSQTRVEDMEFGKPTFNLTLSTSFTSHYMFLFVSPGDTDPSPGGSSK